MKDEAHRHTVCGDDSWPFRVRHLRHFAGQSPRQVNHVLLKRRRYSSHFAVMRLATSSMHHDPRDYRGNSLIGALAVMCIWGKFSDDKSRHDIVIPLISISQGSVIAYY